MATTAISPKIRLLRTAGPSSEPVTVADAKKQLEIASSDTSHDDHLTNAINAAREQFEQDTDYVPISQTFEVILDEFPRNRCPIALPVRPVTSLTSVAYMDGASSETLATSVADLDRRKRNLVLKYDQDWPSVERQNDCVVITLVAGYSAVSTVPRLIRQAILLQVAKWFEDRDMMTPATHEQFDVAYERIIRRLMRSSYP
jgi:uncharacterized phiE125 gp8 family phage protein